MKFHVEHRFANVTLERFVDTYFGEEFNNAVAPISGLKERSLVQTQTRPDGRIERRIRMRPAVSIPSALQRFVKPEQIHYDEVNTYDPRTQEATFFVDSKARDRVDVAGRVCFVVDGDGVRRVLDYEVKVQAPFGVGAMVEQFIESEVQKSYAKIAPFMQRYLDERRPR